MTHYILLFDQYQQVVEMCCVQWTVDVYMFTVIPNIKYIATPKGAKLVRCKAVAAHCSLLAETAAAAKERGHITLA